MSPSGHWVSCPPIPMMSKIASPSSGPWDSYSIVIPFARACGTEISLRCGRSDGRATPRSSGPWRGALGVLGDGPGRPVTMRPGGVSRSGRAVAGRVPPQTAVRSPLRGTRPWIAVSRCRGLAARDWHHAFPAALRPAGSFRAPDRTGDRGVHELRYSGCLRVLDGGDTMTPTQAATRQAAREPPARRRSARRPCAGASPSAVHCRRWSPCRPWPGRVGDQIRNAVGRRDLAGRRARSARMRASRGTRKPEPDGQARRGACPVTSAATP